jgi:hypothetical protein
MKKTILSSMMLLATLSHAQVTPVENSIYNYANSPYNYANSPYNYTNSPYNLDNSVYNPYAPNAVYNGKGDRVGYSTKTDAGVTNYYDNNGNRKGYQVK